MNTKVLRRLANEQISRSMSIDEHGYAVINGLRSAADEIDRLTAENERLGQELRAQVFGDRPIPYRDLQAERDALLKRVAVLSEWVADREAVDATAVQVAAERDTFRQMVESGLEDRDRLASRVTDMERENDRLRNIANQRLCSSCLESHPIDVQCPPHEMRTTGPEWFLERVRKRAVAFLKRTETQE